jgi:hypothetical protein
MQRWQCGVAWVLGLVCLALSVATILLARDNQRMEQTVQEQRTMLERGILGPQGQQVGNNVLQDLAATAQRDAEVRSLLARHGFQVNVAPTNGQATAGSATAGAAPVSGGVR